MKKYNNAKTFLESIGFTLLTTEDEYRLNRRIKFSCIRNHDPINVAIGTFSNRKCEQDIIIDLKNKFCKFCIQEDSNHNRMIKMQEDNDNVTIISFDPKTRKVIYVCPICDKETKTSDTNIKVVTMCRTCSNNKQSEKRNTFEKVDEAMTKRGIQILLTKEEFDKQITNKNMAIPCVCTCGEKIRLRYQCVIRGQNCQKCKVLKYKKTCQERYGVDNIFQLEEIKERSRQTNLIRHGVEYPMQNSEIHRKSVVHRTREYQLNNGRIVKILGYEGRALDEIQDEYKETIYAGGDIEIPSIKYVNENKNSMYHPDIYLKELNKILEVKSDYFLEKEFQLTLLKAEAASKDYDFELWMYLRDGKAERYKYIDGEFVLIEENI